MLVSSVRSLVPGGAYPDHFGCGVSRSRSCCGMIGTSGLRILVDNHSGLQQNRNMILALFGYLPVRALSGVSAGAGRYVISPV